MYKSYKDPKRFFAHSSSEITDFEWLGDPWGCPGGSPWGALGALGEALGVLRGNLGGLEAFLGPFWGLCGRPWAGISVL
jgi:hypothetical protein